ncbi:hypothetical protein CBL_08406 [Carabus blaptoides fortunei]
MRRPSSNWEDSSDRSKRRRTEKIREEHNIQTLAYAIQMSLRASGKLQASKVVKDVTVGSPKKALKYCKSMQRVTENILSGNEALSLVIENKLSRNEYQGIRSVSLWIKKKPLSTDAAEGSSETLLFPMRRSLSMGVEARDDEGADILSDKFLDSRISL